MSLRSEDRTNSVKQKPKTSNPHPKTRIWTFSLLLHHNVSSVDPVGSTAPNAAAPSNAFRTDPITPQEAGAAVRHLNNREVPAFSAITTKMLKSGEHYMVKWLAHTFNKVWETGISQRLDQRVILPFSKHKSDRLFCSNHWSTTDHFSAVCLLIEKSYAFCKDHHPYIRFRGLKATFNSIFHSWMAYRLSDCFHSQATLRRCTGLCLHKW